MLSDIVQLTDHELDQLLDALSQGTIEPGTSLQQIRKAGSTLVPSRFTIGCRRPWVFSGRSRV